MAASSVWLQRHLLAPFSDPDRKRSSHGDAIVALDGVRAFAVLIVIASHSDAFGMRGQGGVGVFLFSCSADSCSRCLFAAHPRRILQWRAVAAFFINRALRILPALSAAVLLLAYMHGQGRGWILANLSFYSGWEHLWSVAEEARFYALFPLLIAALALPPNRITRIAMATAMIPLAWTVRYLDEISLMDGRYADFYLWFFVAGILACLLYGAFVGRRVSKNRIAAKLGSATSALIVLSIFVLAVWPHNLSMNDWHQPEFWSAMMVLLLLSIVLFPDSFISRIMRARPMRHLGLLSYGLYLFHWPVIEFWSQRGLQRTDLFVSVLVTTYVIALISYSVIERPFLMLKVSP